jgi:hypothetical protein
VTRVRPAAWLTASVALFLLAVAGYALLVHADPRYYWEQIDTAVYRDGGIAARNQPAMLYALGLGRDRRVHLARAGPDRRQLLRAHLARVYRGHRVRPRA